MCINFLHPLYLSNENAKIVVDNIEIFIEILSIQKQTVQNLHSKGSTQIVTDIHTSHSKCFLMEIVSSND